MQHLQSILRLEKPIKTMNVLPTTPKWVVVWAELEVWGGVAASGKIGHIFVMGGVQCILQDGVQGNPRFALGKPHP